MDKALEIQHHVGAFYNAYDLHGDGRVCVFSDAPSALRYALHLQNALLCADWPSSLLWQDSADTNVSGDNVTYERGLRLAIGLHTGSIRQTIDPTTGRRSFLGSAVNTAARVCGIAHEGQVVASRALIQQVENSLLKDNPSIDVRPLGEHRLKGVRDKVALFQVLPTVLAEERSFPATQ